MVGSGTEIPYLAMRARDPHPTLGSTMGPDGHGRVDA